MNTLAIIKPKTKHRIIDVVEAAGLDVSDWATAKDPATNPKYCYEWAFTNEARDHILLCLWFDDCEADTEGVLQRGNIRPYILELEATGSPQGRRARSFDEILQDAWRLKVPIRVAIVDETEKKKATKKAGDVSEAAFRELDPVPWQLSSYNMMNGDYVMRRGIATSAEFPTAPSPGPLTGDQPPQMGSQSATVGSAAELGNDRPIHDYANGSQRDTAGGQVSSTADVLEDLLATTNRTDIPATTRQALMAARVGQGGFRAALLKLWGRCCAVTACSEVAVLRASHVKPWRLSNDSERLDPENGLLLTANLDALFDVGLISFTDEGKMLLSKRLSPGQSVGLGLPSDLRIPLSARQREYLLFHRKECFQRSAPARD
jgi:hypothetical protein